MGVWVRPSRTACSSAGQVYEASKVQRPLWSWVIDIRKIFESNFSSSSKLGRARGEREASREAEQSPGKSTSCGSRLHYDAEGGRLGHAGTPEVGQGEGGGLHGVPCRPWRG